MLSDVQQTHMQDEATFDRRDISQDVNFKHLVMNNKPTTMWEQWAGVIHRGRPETLILSRLKPKLTVKRAPGPGAIRRTEWKTLGTKLLKDRKVVLHTDAARSYKAKIAGVIHNKVVHAKKRVKRNGKFIWQHPKYVKVVTHKIPKSNKKIVVKSGTQIIDRCWRFLKDRVKVNQHTNAGSRQLCAKLRSAQYEYWYRNEDLWLKFGELCAENMRKFLK